MARSSGRRTRNRSEYSSSSTSSPTPCAASTACARGAAGGRSPTRTPPARCRCPRSTAAGRARRRSSRQHVGHLGLADAGLALEQERSVQAKREEDGGRQALVGEVVVRGEPGCERPRRRRLGIAASVESLAVDLGIAGRTAAVAGATAGLGFASASALAAEGVARRRSAAASRPESTMLSPRIGHDAVGIVADVGTPEAPPDSSPTRPRPSVSSTSWSRMPAARRRVASPRPNSMPTSRHWH